MSVLAEDKNSFDETKVQGTRESSASSVGPQGTRFPSSPGWGSEQSPESSFPSPEGLTLRPLTMEDVPAMLALQDEVLGALEDPSWYFPSEEWEFASAVEAGEAWGYFDGDVLAGFAEMTPGEARGEHSYAAKLGLPVEHSFDFHDVMVAPAMRRRGIQSAFLAMFTAFAVESGGTAMYATVDPGNGASWRNFERFGYQVVATMPAYDGRMRRFYRLALREE